MKKEPPLREAPWPGKLEGATPIHGRQAIVIPSSERT